MFMLQRAINYNRSLLYAFNCRDKFINSTNVYAMWQEVCCNVQNVLLQLWCRRGDLKSCGRRTFNRTSFVNPSIKYSMQNRDQLRVEHSLVDNLPCTAYFVNAEKHSNNTKPSFNLYNNRIFVNFSGNCSKFSFVPILIKIGQQCSKLWGKWFSC